ncbi:uncharacterized protein VP01_4017g3 [Puccinia sorghi]|uniref:Uncharacterized protein n=1 Tax=Puccinia sorghi TaxID=27349 RepID=A0A0L6URV3_9BASI|nr:uncharacterized protein VP01_4017g3 [Puccinia sorghi]
MDQTLQLMSTRIMDMGSAKEALTGKNIYIFCDCGSYGGRLKNLAKRNTSTRKCECPFQVRGSTSRAILLQSFMVPSTHLHHQQLAPSQVEEVSCLRKSKIKTSQIFLQLQESEYLQKASFLPLYENSKLDPIYIMNINGDHLVLALLKGTDRSKNIPPIIGSTKPASQVTRSLSSEFKEYFSLHNQELQSLWKI